MKKTRIVLCLALAITLMFSVQSPIAAATSHDYDDITELYRKPIDEFNYVTVDKDGNIVDDFMTDGANGPSKNMANNYPESYDSRDNGFVFHEASQGSTSNCWAFAATTALESGTFAAGTVSEMPDYSEAHLVWFAHKSMTTDTTDPTYGDGTDEPTPYSEGGNWYTAVHALARGCGPVLESDYPFSTYCVDGTYPNMGNYDESERYNRVAQLTEAEHIYSNISDDEIKAEILEHGAVKVSYKDISSYHNTYNGMNFYYQPTETKTNHDVTIVGWDDSIPKTNFLAEAQPPYDGAWLCKNSWGDDWGDNGYFWISYNDPSVSQVVTYVAGERYDYIYQYDGFGCNSQITTNLNTICGANIFTARKTEAIAAVGFYSTQDNISYTVKIYNNVTAGDPTSGTLCATASGTEKYEGFHTAVLPEAVTVNSGNNFAAVLEITDNDGSNAYLAVESRSNWLGNHDSKEGQSFYKTASGEWTDLSSGYNNVGIKAFSTCAHDWVAAFITSVDCTEERQVTYICSKCESEKTENLPAMTHAWDDGSLTSEPSCFASSTMLFHCTNSYCNETKTETVPATGLHSWEIGTVILAPTCSTEGSAEFHCTTPGCTAEKTDTVPATNIHNYVFDRHIDGTCTLGAYDVYKCSECGTETNRNEQAATGHSWSEYARDEATCIHTGTSYLRCTNPGCSEETTQTIAASGQHGFIFNKTVAPTCTAGGYDLYKCECGAEERRNTVPATGHTMVLSRTVAPTCTATGRDEYVCSVCSAKENRNITPALGHTDANSDSVCDVCSETLAEQEKPQQEKSFIQIIISFFQRIINFFKNLFK